MTFFQNGTYEELQCLLVQARSVCLRALDQYELAWDTYQIASHKILTQLAVLDQNPQQYGIIHGDLHMDNIVFNDEQPNPIDFGRCGYGYYLYDIAHTILGLFPAQRLEFIRGYESVRIPPTDYVEILESFFIMCMIENYSHHSSDPREASGLIDEQPYAQACIREYLRNAPLSQVYFLV